MKKLIFIFSFILCFFCCGSVFSQEIVKDQDLFDDIASEYDTGLSDEDLLLEDSLFESKEGTKPNTKEISDPIEGVNRVVFYFNDKVYVYLFTPVSKGYKKVTPKFVRTGIGNFFSNLGSPIRAINNLLQGKVKGAGAETGRFFVNTFLGFLGFVDSASTIDALNTPKEDLGQTFGKWGIGPGFYIVVPFLGPTSLRDGVGTLGNIYIDPLNYVYLPLDEGGYALMGVNGLNNLPPQMELYKTLKDSSLDPYTAAKNAYSQLRQNEIKK